MFETCAGERWTEHEGNEFQSYPCIPKELRCWECLTNDLGLCVGMIRFLRKTSARTRTWKGGKCEACRGRSQDQAAGDGGWRFLAGLGPRFTVRCLALWKIWGWYLYPKRILQIITSLNMSWCFSKCYTYHCSSSNVFFWCFLHFDQKYLKQQTISPRDFSTPNPSMGKNLPVRRDVQNSPASGLSLWHFSLDLNSILLRLPWQQKVVFLDVIWVLPKMVG